MKASDFDYTRFREFKAEREEAAQAFLRGDTSFMLQERAGCNYVICRTPEESLAMQLDAITSNMNFASGYLPYLEPWFGVGVFANAFGCSYEWIEGESPQTHYIVHSIEEAARLTRPEISNSPVMQLVLDAIDYFRAETRGEIPISLTDTQSPFDTATLIWDTGSFFTAMYEAPDVVHKVLDMITDVIIEFTSRQIEHLGNTWSRPGHIMFSTPDGPGMSVSDDNIVMVSPETYAGFAIPYNERLAESFGGLAVHSCGNFERQLPALLKTRGLFLVDGAFSAPNDPNPNLDYALWRETMKNTNIILQPRLHLDWPDILPQLYDPKLRLAPVVPAPAAGEPINKNQVLLESILAALS